MAKKTDKQVYKDAVVLFRRKHYVSEMETNLTVATEIRDNPKASARDRNEAIKTIARMLGGLTPERSVTTKKDEATTVPVKEVITSTEQARIKAILDEK